MDQDDRTIGRLLTRRETLALLGVSGAGLLLGCRPSPSTSSGIANDASPVPVSATGTAPCVVRPEQTEGPYFVDERLDRSDIRTDPGSGVARDGAPLDLAFAVSRIDGGRCAPLAGARVDVWHCDAGGVYSDVRDPGFDTSGQQFLRGYQLTDASGAARFTTIYPGWYAGRAVHIHFKIRMTAEGAITHEFTSQLYFDEAVTDRVHAQAPYGRSGRRLRNEQDGLYRDGGDRLRVAVAESARRYAATFEVGLLA